MMTLLSTAVTALAGPLFRAVTLPAIIITALIFAKAAWDKRDARLLKQGEMICDARWEENVRQQEREAAASNAAASQRILESERQTSEALREQVSRLNEEMDGLRANSGTDSKCLSDGVLDALRKRQGGKRKAASG